MDIDQVKEIQETEPDLKYGISVLYDKTAEWTSEYAFMIIRAILSLKMITILDYSIK